MCEEGTTKSTDILAVASFANSLISLNANIVWHIVQCDIPNERKQLYFYVKDKKVHCSVRKYCL